MRSKSWKRSWLSATERRIERPGVVDEHVDRGVVGRAICSTSVVDRVEVGQVGRVDVGRAAVVLDLGLGLLELVQRRGRRAAGCRRPAAILSAAAWPMPDEAPVMTHGLAVDRVPEGAVAEQVRVEVALPVVPQLVRVGVELGHLDARALQRALGVARVELRGEADVLDDLAAGCRSRPAAVLRTSVSAGSFISIEIAPLGSASIRRLSMRSAICGACAARAKALSTSPERWPLGLVEVEGLAVEVGLVGDVVHRLGDVVDRDDVRVAELGADERHPLRQAGRGPSGSP